MQIRLLLLSLSLVVWPLAQTVFGCAGDFDHRAFSLFLTPYNIQDVKYNYLYTMGFYTYDEYSTNQIDEREINLKEWQEYFGSKNVNDITSLVYKNNTADLKSLQAARQKGKSFKSVNLLRKNSCFPILYKDELLLDYFVILNDYNNNVNSFEDEWLYSYHVKETNLQALKLNIDESKKLFKNIEKKNKKKYKSLLRRLAYHIVRSNYFNKNKATAREDFEMYAQPLMGEVSESIINAWLIGLEAGLYAEKGKHNKAFLLFAKKFNEAASSNYQAYIDLKWLSKKVKIERVLALAKNQQDSVSAFAAFSAVRYQLSSEIFRKYIASIASEETQKFVWYREMQKVDESYMHHAILHDSRHQNRWETTGEYYDNKQSDESVANFRAFTDITETLYASATGNNKEMYANALAYIYLTSGKKQDAQKFLDYPYSTARGKQRNTILKLFKQTLDREKLNLHAIVSILNSKEYHNDSWYDEDASTMHYFVRGILAPHMLNIEKDTFHSLFLLSVGQEDTIGQTISLSDDYGVGREIVDYMLNVESYERLKQEIHTNNSALMKWARNKNKKVELGRGGQSWLLFSKYIRDQNFDKALALDGVTKQYDFSENNIINPFIMRYDERISRCDLDYQRPTMTLTDFLKLGIKLKKKVINGTGQDYLNYGMYLYSISHHGRNAHLGGFYYSPTMDYTPAYHDINYITSTDVHLNHWSEIKIKANKRGLEYLGSTAAIPYLEKAFEKLDNREAKAMSCFMLAKCYQKRAPMPEYVWKGDGYKYKSFKDEKYKGKRYSTYLFHSLRNPYFKILRDDFRDTKTFEEAEMTCDYLRDYLD